MTKLAIAKIRIDGGTQPRAEINQNTVDEYAEAMADGAKFPPPIVYFDGTEYWLADGFHRYYAAKKNGQREISVGVQQGTRRDAVLFSVGANAKHGLRRTNEDKKRAVVALLSDAEWQKWSNREIARKCGVSESFVRSLRLERSENTGERTYTTKHGTPATMQTGNIGKGTPPTHPVEDEEDSPRPPEKKAQPITYSQNPEFNQDVPDIPFESPADGTDGADSDNGVELDLTTDGVPCRFQPKAGDVGVCPVCGRHGDWVRLPGDRWQCGKCARRYPDDSIEIWNADTQARDRKLAKRKPAPKPSPLAPLPNGEGKKALLDKETAEKTIRRMLIDCGLDVFRVAATEYPNADGTQSYMAHFNLRGRLSGIAVAIDGAFEDYLDIVWLQAIEAEDDDRTKGYAVLDVGRPQ